MKPLIILTTVTCATSMVQAQSLYFNSSSLESGTALKQGAVYRFNDVISGSVDALVTITQIQENTTLLNIDSMDASSVKNAAFRPIIKTLSPDGNSVVGSVSFGFSFVNKGTTETVSLDEFGLMIIDTDGDDDLSNTEDGDLREFVFADGSLAFRGSALSEVTSALVPVGAVGSLATTSFTNVDTVGGLTSNPDFRTDYTYANTDSINLRLGAIGNDFIDDVDNDRLYGVYFTGETPVMVPEPSSAALLGLGVLGFVLRRRR